MKTYYPTVKEAKYQLGYAELQVEQARKKLAEAELVLSETLKLVDESTARESNGLPVGVYIDA